MFMIQDNLVQNVHDRASSRMFMIQDNLVQNVHDRMFMIQDNLVQNVHDDPVSDNVVLMLLP